MDCLDWLRNVIYIIYKCRHVGNMNAYIIIMIELVTHAYTVKNAESILKRIMIVIIMMAYIILY